MVALIQKLAQAPATRTCWRCKRELPLDPYHFYRSSGHGHFGFQRHCSDCNTALAKENHARNRKERNRRTRERRHSTCDACKGKRSPTSKSGLCQNCARGERAFVAKLVWLVPPMTLAAIRDATGLTYRQVRRRLNALMSAGTVNEALIESDGSGGRRDGMQPVYYLSRGTRL